MASALLDTGGLPPGGLGLPTKPGAGLELSFSLDDPAFGSDHFRMYDFKVKRCPRARPHDWTACPFAHPGEKAKRRDPRRYRYSGTACPDFRKTGVCRRGDACPYSHGVFECWLHPSRYRTQMCTDGPSCRRRVCFFAHYEHELRRAEEYPQLLNQQLHAGLVADARALQQQQLAQALSGILGNSAPQMGGGPPSSLEPLMSMQLLKTLSQGTPSALVDSNPTTPTGIAGLSPNSAAAGGLLHDNSKLLMQLQMMQQQQQHAAGASAAAAAALGSLAATVSDASQHSAHSGHSGSSPGGSPRYMTCPGEMFTPGGVVDASRQGSPPVHGADEASQLARLIQQQQQQQQAAAAQAAAVAGGIDPALLAALQNLGLGAAGSMQEGLDVASLTLGLSRRSADNGALSRQYSGSSSDNYLAAAAAALASGTAVGGLGHGHSHSHGAQTGGALSPSSMGGGSIPSHSYMGLARSSGGMAGGQPSSPPAIEDNPTLSLDHILAELPRSASQVRLPTQ